MYRISLLDEKKTHNQSRWMLEECVMKLSHESLLGCLGAWQADGAKCPGI